MFAFPMGTNQENNEAAGFLVDPLINGFGANGLSRVFEGQSSSDKLRRPSQADVLCDIPPDKVIFKPFSPVRFVLSFGRSFLGFVREIISGINGRGISLKLSRKRARISLEDLGDLSQGVAFGFEHRKKIPFIGT